MRVSSLKELVEGVGEWGSGVESVRVLVDGGDLEGQRRRREEKEKKDEE